MSDLTVIVFILRVSMVKGLVRIKWKSLKIPIQSTSVNWTQIRCVFVLRYGAKCVYGNQTIILCTENNISFLHHRPLFRSLMLNHILTLMK